MPAWGEKLMLSIPEGEPMLYIELLRKRRFRSPIMGTASISVWDMPLKTLQGDARHEIEVTVAPDTTLVLQCSLLCFE